MVLFWHSGTEKLFGACQYTQRDDQPLKDSWEVLDLSEPSLLMLTSIISEESRNQVFPNFFGQIFSIFESPIRDFPFNPSTMELS